MVSKSIEEKLNWTIQSWWEPESLDQNWSSYDSSIAVN